MSVFHSVFEMLLGDGVLTGKPLPVIRFSCGHTVPILDKEKFVQQVIDGNPLDVSPMAAGAILSGELLEIAASVICDQCLAGGGRR